MAYYYTCVCTYLYVIRSAWCLSDHEISDIMEVFLSSIKTISPLTNVTVMMTDDGIDRH